MLALLFWLLASDPNCTSRAKGLAAPECITYGHAVDVGKPILTCRAACYTADRPKRPDGGVDPADTHVVHAETPGEDSAATRATCRSELQRQADNGCHR